MQIKTTIELTVDGVAVDFRHVPEKDRCRVESAFERIYADLAGSEIDGTDVEYGRLYKHVSTTVVGLPVPVSAEQAEAIKHTKYEHGKEDDVLDVNNDGTALYVLRYSGSRRVLAYVRARYTIAKRLGCSPVVENGGVSWRGEFTFEVSE
jgi:hypothetical protein